MTREEFYKKVSKIGKQYIGKEFTNDIKAAMAKEIAELMNELKGFPVGSISLTIVDNEWKCYISPAHLN